MNRILACCLASLLPGAFALNASAQTSCTPCNLEFNVPAVPVVEMGCGDGDVLMALPPFPPFTDGCNGDTWNLFFRHSTDWVHTCEVGNGTPAAGAERTMRLVGLTSSGLVTSDLFVVTGAGLTWTSYPENVARLQGQVTNLADPNAGFEVDLFFDAQAPADAWVAQGGGLDVGAATGGAEAAWVVWSLKPYMSKLLGQGSLAGLQVVLTPSSFDNGYGFQEGANGANLLNAQPGLGGHFDWQFCTGPNTFAGHGTLTAETANCQELNAACGNNPDAVGVYFDGAPNTSILSAHGNVADGDLGLGGTLALDAIGITSTMEVSGNASYHLDMGTSRLSFGLRGGMLQYRARLADVVGIDPADPVYQGSEIGAWIPRFGFGVLFERNTWHVGVSTPTLFVFEQALTQGIEPYYRNHVYAHGGMALEANSWLVFEPSVLFRSTPDLPSVLDLNLLATVRDTYTLGMCFRTGSGLTLVSQCRFNDQFRVGYMRDVATTDIQSYAGGTHEVFLGWSFETSKPRIAMPQGM